MQHSATGLLVVRKPSENFDERGRGAYSSVAPLVDGLYYGGIFRMPWFDVEEDYYSHTLPPEILSIYKDLRKRNRDFTGLMLTDDLQIANTLLDYSNRRKNRNELVAASSPLLSRVKQLSIDLPHQCCTSLGYDVVSLGHWSLLLHGVFMYPRAFPEWVEVLNANGLFDSPKRAIEYSARYDAASRANEVEELPDEVYGMDAVRLVRVESS